MKIALVLVGYGNVARRFVQLLDESREYLTTLNIDPVIAAIVTRRHGRLYESAGLEPKRMAKTLIGSGAADGQPLPFLTSALDRLRSEAVEARVVVETTTLDVRSGEPAISHVRAALARGAHVITANKGPVAFAYRALAAEAATAGVSFLFEGAVMDGVPIFGLVREAMPALDLRGFRGVVNSTTNYLITAMERGEAFDAALARMQDAGVAEADPSLDVDGWDAAAKAAALANVLLDADLTPLAVAREGISAQTAARAQAAAREGKRLKLLASATGRGDSVRAEVALVELDASDPLAILDGQANALELDTWPLGRVVITQRDGGLEKTAYALLADLVSIGRRNARSPEPHG